MLGIEGVRILPGCDQIHRQFVSVGGPIEEVPAEKPPAFHIEMVLEPARIRRDIIRDQSSRQAEVVNGEGFGESVHSGRRHQAGPGLRSGQEAGTFIHPRASKEPVSQP